jgi:hypothetical protein
MCSRVLAAWDCALSSLTEFAALDPLSATYIGEVRELPESEEMQPFVRQTAAQRS